MARCHGPDSPYGCGHHAEHVAAARKGWLTRRRRHAWVHSEDHDALRRVVGDVSDVHTHDKHPRSVMMRQGGKWYELPKAEYKSLVRAGREMARDEERERKARDRARKLIEAERGKASRQAERERQQAERYRAMQERQAAAVARAERAEVVKIIKRAGGIRPNPSGVGRGEYAALPADVRRRNGRVTMDQARADVMDEMPWLNPHDEYALTDFFERSRMQRVNTAHHRRHAA